MRLLQVANVSRICGGTGACAWSIIRALPNWQHTMFFRQGRMTPELKEHFGCDVVIDEKLTPLLIETAEPDVILFHNTPEFDMPNFLSEKVITFYYQHSAHKAAVGARKRCDMFWSVSDWLGKQANIGTTFYQPCTIPKGDSSLREENVIGRICTPERRKWSGCESLYDVLSDTFPEVMWEFVGCPEVFQESLSKACNGRCRFLEPSWEARSHLWRWKAVLYDSPIVESYGRVVCEAQRCGCVPIVCDRGGFSEQIWHAGSGFRCSSPQDFVDAVKHVLNPDVFANLSKSAKEHGDQRGSLSIWSDTFHKWVKAAA